MKNLFVITLMFLFATIYALGQNVIRIGAEEPDSVILPPSCLIGSNGDHNAKEYVVVSGSLQPVPSVDFHPGLNYADVNRNFGVASSITKTPGGRLYCGFTSGDTKEGIQNYGIVVFSENDGLTWSSPYIVLDTDGDGPIRSDHVTVWTAPSGELWIMWSQYPEGLRGSHSSLWAIRCSNPDAEPNHQKWSSPRKLADEQNLLTTPTVLSDGTWIFPTGNWMRDRKRNPSRPLISRDSGISFELGGPLLAPIHPDDPDFDEYMIVERSDGHLVILDRHRRSFLQYESKDKGRTWILLQPNGLPHMLARFVFMKLHSGNWLLVKHGTMDADLEQAVKRGRTHLMAYLSRDEGKTWEGGLLLDERSCSYPFGFQDTNGTIYVSYERERFNKPEILMARFTEADVTTGKAVSDCAGLKLLVNKAAGGQSAILPNQNKDGEQLFTGPMAVIEPARGEICKLAIGGKIFSNRDYTFTILSEAIVGKSFVFSEIETKKAFCRKPGVVYVLTPRPERNESESLERTLLENGFVKSNVPEFFLFSLDEDSMCSIYQKQVKAGESIELGLWGLLVF